MIKIDIISGFLGAGKTTLIKKLVKEAYAGEKIVLIENEFGEIGVDGGFLKEAGIEITEMNSGCICCSLVGDFSKALVEVASRFTPDRIVIEPSGVGKLSDVIRAVERAAVPGSVLNSFSTVVDAKKCKLYLKNFGEFFLDQVEHASCIILSHTSDPAKTEEAVALLREHTQKTIVTTDWNALAGADILAVMQQSAGLEEELAHLAAEEHEHHHDDDDDEHEHHHHHHDDDDEDEHEHHHCHHDDDDEDEHEHHHHHHADEIFSSWGAETAKQFTREQLAKILEALGSGKYGQILRAKGIVDGGEVWYHFDYVPEETDIRTGGAIVTGRLCVIGCGLDESALKTLFLG